MNPYDKENQGLSGMEKLLAKPDKGIKETLGIAGIPARLWRTILFDLGMNFGTFEALLSDFINTARNKNPLNRISKFFTRGNLRREFEKPKMTIKVLMKGIQLLKAKKVTIAIEIEFEKRTTFHEIKVDLGSRNNSAEIFDGSTDQDAQPYEERKDIPADIQ